MKKILLVLLVLLFAVSAKADDKKTITWVYLEYPPLYIENPDKDNDPSGIGRKAIDLIAKNMPDYDHIIQGIPFARILIKFKAGENIAFFGLCRNPEREKFIQYSIPCRLDTPNFLFIRRNELAKYGGGKPVSLKELFSKPDFNIVIKKGVSYGTTFDSIFAEHKDRTYEVTSLQHGQEYQMIALKRTDATIGAADGVFALKKLPELNEKLAILPIVEDMDWAVCYVGLPKTIWGNEVRQQVNNALRKLIPTDEFYDIYKALVKQGMRDELRQRYDKNILQPSRME